MMIMAPSSAVKYLNRQKIAVILTLMILSFSLLFSSNAGAAESMMKLMRSDHVDSSNDDGLIKRMKMVLGSKPPRCVDKCLSCRPCMAALVISQHHNNGVKESPHEHESYYLLAWKCKCRDKIFQP